MPTAAYRQQIIKRVDQALRAQPIWDLHTHLYPPTFGTPVPNRTQKTDSTGLMLWGVDELVTYHYLVAEVFRVVPATKLPYDQFWAMPKTAQADHIWKHLFQERSPVSEACRGVLTALEKIGLDPREKTLAKYRKFFAKQDPSDYVDKVMDVSHVSVITMTNAVFDDHERNRWLANPSIGNDERFRGVLRIDPILRQWPAAAARMAGWGYAVDDTFSPTSVDEGRRFLREWIKRTKALYIAASLPPEYRFPADPSDPVAASSQKALEQIVLPVCREEGLALALMIGSRLKVNPDLRDAGDMVGKSDIFSITELCRRYPQNKFLLTMLARDNQHEMAVAARKFGNLMIFGCWWFLNNPSLIEEIMRMRFELLGTSFVPQHSDARVLDQLVYKWEHSTQILAKVLADKYLDMADAGRRVTNEEVRRDVALLFHDNVREFIQRKA